MRPWVPMKHSSRICHSSNVVFHLYNMRPTVFCFQFLCQGRLSTQVLLVCVFQYHGKAELWSGQTPSLDVKDGIYVGHGPHVKEWASFARMPFKMFLLELNWNLGNEFRQSQAWYTQGETRKGILSGMCIRVHVPQSGCLGSYPGYPKLLALYK